MTTKFVFSTVEEGFDNHIRMSIPNLEQLYSTTEELLPFFLSSGSKLIDLGCSTGAITRRLAEKFSEVEVIGLDYETNFRNEWVDNLVPDNLDFEICDITKDGTLSEYVGSSNVFTSFFTLQFLNHSDRHNVLSKVAHESDSTMFVAEKVFANDARMDRAFQNILLKRKRESGFTDKEILDKEQTLVGYMHILDSRTLEDQLRTYFNRVEIYWCSYGFRAYVCRNV